MPVVIGASCLLVRRCARCRHYLNRVGVKVHRETDETVLPGWLWWWWWLSMFVALVTLVVIHQMIPVNKSLARFLVTSIVDCRFLSSGCFTTVPTPLVTLRVGGETFHKIFERKRQNLEQQATCNFLLPIGSIGSGRMGLQFWPALVKKICIHSSR